MSDKGTSATTSGGEAPSEATVRLLQWLERRPKVVVFISVLVITIAILITPGPAGGVLTLVLAGASGYLVYTTWRRPTATPTRFARVLVVIALTALAAGKLFL